MSNLNNRNSVFNYREKMFMLILKRCIFAKTTAMTTVTFQTNNADAMRLYSMIQSYGVEIIEMKEDTDKEAIRKEVETAITLDELRTLVEADIKEMYRNENYSIS